MRFVRLVKWLVKPESGRELIGKNHKHWWQVFGNVTILELSTGEKFLCTIYALCDISYSKPLIVLSMNNNETIPTIRTPVELLDAIPPLIGFTPADSLVAVVVKNKLIYVTARLDIAACETREGVQWLAERLTHGPDGKKLAGIGVFLVGYSERSRAQQAVLAMCEALGALTKEALVVDGDFWWRIDEKLDTPGHKLPRKGRMSRILSQDNPVMASREELARSIAAPTGKKEDEMLDAVMMSLDLIPEEDPPLAGQRIVAVMDQWSHGRPITDEEYLSAVMTVSMGPARDEIWKILTKAKAEEYLPFWKQAMTRTPKGVRTAALAVTGIMAWIAGEGALMNICLEEAEATDPEYPLVEMLNQISLGGLPPSYWDKLNPTLQEKPPFSQQDPLVASEALTSV